MIKPSQNKYDEKKKIEKIMHVFSHSSLLYFFSGVGVGMVRDVSTLMVAQYFKRKRELVEIIVVSASGVGISINSVFINGATRDVTICLYYTYNTH